MRTGNMVKFQVCEWLYLCFYPFPPHFLSFLFKLKVIFPSSPNGLSSMLISCTGPYTRYKIRNFPARPVCEGAGGEHKAPCWTPHPPSMFPHTAQTKHSPPAHTQKAQKQQVGCTTVRMKLLFYASVKSDQFLLCCGSFYFTQIV